MVWGGKRDLERLKKKKKRKRVGWGVRVGTLGSWGWVGARQGGRIRLGK